MKKWIFILIAVAVGFHFGWRFLVEYFAKKGVPKSHIVGYLIYRDKYLTNRGPATGDKREKKEETKKPADQAPPKPKKPKTLAEIKKEYNLKKITAKTKRDKLNAETTYYKDLIAIEKDPLKKKTMKAKLVDYQAQLYATTNTDVQYKTDMDKYQEVQGKIENYRKNGVRPPAKLLSMAKTNPDKQKIYQMLYAREKKRLQELSR